MQTEEFLSVICPARVAGRRPEVALSRTDYEKDKGKRGLNTLTTEDAAYDYFPFGAGAHNCVGSALRDAGNEDHSGDDIPAVPAEPGLRDTGESGDARLAGAQSRDADDRR